MKWLDVGTEPDDIARLLARHDLAPPTASGLTLGPAHLTIPQARFTRWNVP